MLEKEIIELKNRLEGAERIITRKGAEKKMFVFTIYNNFFKLVVENLFQKAAIIRK
jgi:hypothetical protein